MSAYTFIVNPRAGRGSGRKILAPLQEQLRKRGAEHAIALTRGPGDATSLARAAAGSVIVAVGGDGTVNEVANGLSGSGRILGIVPTGSGNDFIKSIGISRNLAQALDVVFSGNVRAVDVGMVQCGNGNSSLRCFVNGVGIGFDAAVAARTAEIRHVKGTALYLAAVLQTLRSFSAPVFHLRVDEHRQESRNLLIAVGNGTCAGGGFYLTPDAQVDDGILDLCIVDDLPISKILRLIPKVMRSNHRDAEGVTFMKGRSIALRSDTPFFVHADGEIVGRNVREVEIRVKPKHQRVLVGAMGTVAHA